MSEQILYCDDMSPSTFQSLFDALQHSLTLRETYLLTFFMQYYLHTYIIHCTYHQVR